MTKNTALRTLDHPVYNRWQALYLAWFSPRLYVDVANRWRGSGLRYLLLLLCLSTLPFAVRIAVDFNRYFNATFVHPVNRLPPLYIQQGKVSLDKPMPYFVKNAYGNVAIIVDTSGSITSIDNRYPELTLLITKDKIIYSPLVQSFFLSQEFRPQENPTYTQTLDPSLNEIFEGNRWVSSSGIKKLQYVTEFAIYPLLIGFYLGLYLLLLVAFALLGQVIAKVFYKLSLGYRQTLRLLIVSATASIMLSFLTLTLGWVFKELGVLLLLVLIIYFNFALWSLKRDSHKLVGA